MQSGFNPLVAKPSDFIVALGDSFSSGEGAGAYAAWSDHDGDDEDVRNACHQSANAWIRKTILPGGDTSSIGARDAARDNSLDFHFLACSGAESENLLPYATAGSPVPANGAGGELGRDQWGGMVTQLDAGYLDENTTLVTLSIGGNDVKFSPILAACATVVGDCSDIVIEDDNGGAYAEAIERLDEELPETLDTILTQVRQRAPNALIALVGYPRLFDIGTSCILVGEQNRNWLNDVSDTMTEVIANAAYAADTPSKRVIFVDPQAAFQDRTLCSGLDSGGLNGLRFDFTAGDLPFGVPDGTPNTNPVSQQSVHPNDVGTSMYADALMNELIGGVYP